MPWPKTCASVEVSTGKILSWDTIGKKNYELNNHLGNVMAVISDSRTLNSGNYDAQLLAANDYYAFGSQMPARNVNLGAYRYGFNGKENDNEVKKDAGGNDIVGAQQDYGMRIYDPRIARFLSVDPLSVALPWNSTYSFEENDVVRSIDLEGSERKIVVHWLDGFHGDGAPKIIRTSVDIDKSVRYKGPNGEMVSKTELFYGLKSGRLVHVGDLYEKIGAKYPKPSANYDYSNADIPGKSHDDFEYIGLSTKRLGEIIERDVEAPDNAQTLEDVSVLDAVFAVIGFNTNSYKPKFTRIPNIGIDVTEQGYTSFTAFKRAFGAAGKGNAWHHIVEQNANNIAKFGAENIHTPSNLIKLKHGAGSIHAKLSGFYSSKQAFTNGKTVREWLSGQTYKQQYDFGIKTLKQFGWKE